MHNNPVAQSSHLTGATDVRQVPSNGPIPVPESLELRATDSELPHRVSSEFRPRDDRGPDGISCPPVVSRRASIVRGIDPVTGYIGAMHPLPDAHKSFLDQALPALQADLRVHAVVIAGSAVTGGMDEWSDLDLVVLVEDVAEVALAQEHFEIAARLGTLLQAFRGDHVGEPRLLICLYDAPLLHVDVKFMANKDASTLRYPAEVLWARAAPPELPAPAPAKAFDLQWCADRLPGWAHYLGIKIGRGEWFEALNSLDFVRTRVLAPLIAREVGATPRGVRRLEETRSPRLEWLARTVCTYDRTEIATASKEAMLLAWSLLDAAGPGVNRNRPAEERALGFLNEVAERGIDRNTL